MSLWYNQSVPQISSVEDLIQIIRQHPEWREVLLSALLPQDLLLLPQEFRDFRAEMRERMERYGRRIAAIEEQHARQHLRAERQKRKSSEPERESIVMKLLWGYRVESFFGLFLRYVRIYVPSEFYDDELEQCISFTDPKFEQLLSLDHRARGMRCSDGKEIVLAIKISWGVGVTDVIRARDGALILQECGFHAVPVAVGDYIAPEARLLVEREHVLLRSLAGVEGEQFSHSVRWLPENHGRNPSCGR